MQDHVDDPGVFVRSMASRGHLGGLSSAAPKALAVLDAAGYPWLVVETVGVGQDEVDVVEMAHTTAVVSIPGMGDDIQAIKAGILEIGDVFIVNKADLPHADRVAKQLSAMLHLREPVEGGWDPPIVKTEAERAKGIAELVDTIERHRDHLEASDGLARKAGRRNERVFHDLLRERAAARVLAEHQDGGSEILEGLRQGRLDPYSAVDALLPES